MIRKTVFIRTFAFVMVLIALAIRITIPSGWMPSSEKTFALTVCTGMDVQTIWLDKQGALHKDDPSKGKSIDHPPCAFAGMANAADLPAHFVLAARIGADSDTPSQLFLSAAIGRGLAAPPPPATGPPSYI